MSTPLKQQLLQQLIGWKQSVAHLNRIGVNCQISLVRVVRALLHLMLIGDRRNSKIIDPTASLASSVLSSGMMSGITSPARPWFRLATPDPDLMDYGP